MILVNLNGGLGNQMFQYACGRALSYRLQEKLLLCADQFAMYNNHNGFELFDTFGILSEIATTNQIKDLIGLQASPNLRRFIAKKPFSKLRGKNWCLEPTLDYWPGIQSVEGSIYLHGYWQSEKYFSTIADRIRKDFQFKLKLSADDYNVLADIKSAPSVSIHVRRGDYQKLRNKKIFHECDKFYYDSAIRFLKGKTEILNYFVFSDDIEWVKNNLTELPIGTRFISHNKGKNSAHDMYLMTNTNFNVISNSTFSWWGAWLNNNTTKIVIAPKHWFKDKQVSASTYPQSWICL